jgi:WD40 repeat protein
VYTCAIIDIRIPANSHEMASARVHKKYFQGWLLMRIATILRPVSAHVLALAFLVQGVQILAQSFAPRQEPTANSIGAITPEYGLSTEIQFEKLPGATSAPVVTALAGSKDGRYLAVAGDDHAIRIIETGTGTTIQTVLGHQDWIQSLLFVYPPSPPGSTEAVVPELYSAGHDGRVLCWKYTFPLEAEEVAIVPYAVRSISVSAERNLLAIGGFADEVLIYDLALGQYVHRLKCDSKDQRTVRFSPDGGRVLSGSRDGQIRVWDTNSGELIADYRHHQRRIHTAVFSTDGKCVTSASEDRHVLRYELDAKRVLWSTELALSKMMSLCLVNDDMIAVAGADNKIRLLDAQSESVVAELAGHTGTVAVMTACGESLASGSFDTTVRVWNLAELEQRRGGSSVPISRTPIKMDANTQIR